MPRSSQYLLEGYTYHLTQRCHNRQFLMRFARDRDVYREWLREGVKRHCVPVYGFCITGNHVHIIVHTDRIEAVSRLMHLASGATAKQYNLRKGHLGSMWEHPYQCTLVQDGAHLFNCLCYVELNMVRAGAVPHPREWRWSGYDELIGTRERYRLLDLDRLLQSLDIGSIETFRTLYNEAIEQRIADRLLAREAHWTESLVVGSRAFIERTQTNYRTRWNLSIAEVRGKSTDTWTIRESPVSYGTF